MAHLPETDDDLDAPLPAGDPVVRAPKSMVVLPETPGFPRRMLVAIAFVGMLIGGTLGAAGLGIVYATNAPVEPGRTGRATARGTRAPNTAGGDAGTVLLALEADAGTAEVRPTGPEANYTSSTQRLGRGRTFPAVLRALRLPNALSVPVVRAMRAVVNMRSLQPGDTIVVMRDPASADQVRRVELRRSPTEVYAATVDDRGEWRAEHIEMTQSTVRVAAGFRVEGTLEDTLRAAHLQPDIVTRLQEVFPLLDLGRELRQGDVVRLIVQEDRLNGTFFRYTNVEAIEYRGAMGHRRAFHQSTGARSGDFYDSRGRTFDRGPLRPPVNPARVTSPFNPRRMHPVLRRIMPHQGTDFGAPMGAQVFAAADGTVTFAANSGPTGNLVRLSHPQLGVETGYAHLSRFAEGLRVGMHVRVHQLIGYVGSTGRSTGPHLHFSLKRGGQFIDAMTMCSIRRAVPQSVRAEFEQNVTRLTAELRAIRVAGDDPTPATEAPADETGDPATEPTEETPAQDAPPQE